MFNKKLELAYKVKLRRPKIDLAAELFGYLGRASKPSVRTVGINKLNTKPTFCSRSAFISFVRFLTIIFGCFPIRKSQIGIYNTNALSSP
jgi:hypothetical protein